MPPQNPNMVHPAQYPQETDVFESPMFQFNQASSNQRQRAFNQQARQQDAFRRAQLELQGDEAIFRGQQSLSGLLQELANNELQNLFATTSGARSLSDLGIRAANAQRQTLLDQLQLNRLQNQLDPQSVAVRARRLLGVA